MQQRQLRLGDILDDYCPRERRLTNHAVVAMVGDDVKQTRCTTCDAEHEYKHAKVPRQRRKAETPAALYAQVARRRRRSGRRTTPQPRRRSPCRRADAADRRPRRRRAIDGEPEHDDHADDPRSQTDAPRRRRRRRSNRRRDEDDATSDDDEEGPVHRPLIRASLPRPEGQPPPARPAPEFTIRQPGGRPESLPSAAPARRASRFKAIARTGNMGGGPWSRQRRRTPAQGAMPSRLARPPRPGPQALEVVSGVTRLTASA